MMLFLMKDVVSHGFKMGSTHGESPIAFLSREPRQSESSMNPRGRLAFDLAHDIGQTMRCAQSREHVDVITRASYRMGDPL